MAVVKKDNGTVAVASGGGRKRRKPLPLEEDDYLAGLDRIIQRDFFPDLTKLRTQNEYLSAVERNDVSKIRQLQMRFSSRRTDQTRPGSAIATPASLAGQACPSELSVPDVQSGEQKVNVNMGLDKFLTKYTSEDNASFEEILHAQEERLKEKNVWMYEGEKANASRIANAQALPGADEQLMLPAPETSETTDGWTYRAKNAVMFVPDGVDWTVEEQMKRAQLAERVINHKSTRLEVDPFAELTAKPQPPSGHVAQIGFKNPLQRFSTVVTPSPVPGLCESPLMTWGEIDGTPFRLDGSETPIRRTPGPSFKIPGVPLRDKLAISMTDEISKKYRRKKEEAKKAAAALTPKFCSARSSERIASMSPAAQRFATTKLGIRLASERRIGLSPSPARSVRSTALAKQSEGTEDNNASTKLSRKKASNFF